jgi:protein-S-isoprenylcysteine O-methyltransferase Ste14
VSVSGVWRRLPFPEEHVAGIGFGLVVDRLARRRWPRWTRPPGLLLVAVGALVNAAAVVAHGGGDLDRPSALVRRGPYAWSRNPMYLGWSLIHLGTALAARSPGMSITWPLSAVLVHRTIQREERRLAERFGGEFAAYAAAVPRYLDARSGRSLIRSVRARGRRRPRRSGTSHRA